MHCFYHDIYIYMFSFPFLLLIIVHDLYEYNYYCNTIGIAHPVSNKHENKIYIATWMPPIIVFNIRDRYNNNTRNSYLQNPDIIWLFTYT